MRFLIGWVLLVPALAAASVKIEAEKYNGWDHAFRISNGTVDIVAVPKIGRVIRYGYVGGPNILWENLPISGLPKSKTEYSNYGGEKLWPAPQSEWGWPPDEDLDGTEWTTTLTKSGVHMESPISKKTKLQFLLDVSVADVGTEVKLHAFLVNHGPAHAYAPWHVTQVNNPSEVFLPTESTSALPTGWHGFGDKLDPKFHTLVRNGLSIRRSTQKSYKFGAFSRSGEIKATVGSSVIHVTTKVYPRAKYCDTGSPLEVYTNAGPEPFVELEHLGPYDKLETGQGTALDITWRLTPQ
jgi:hypothetical protein